jgi:hypothetical protein
MQALTNILGGWFKPSGSPRSSAPRSTPHESPPTTTSRADDVMAATAPRATDGAAGAQLRSDYHEAYSSLLQDRAQAVTDSAGKRDGKYTDAGGQSYTVVHDPYSGNTRVTYDMGHGTRKAVTFNPGDPHGRVAEDVQSPDHDRMSYLDGDEVVTHDWQAKSSGGFLVLGKGTTTRYQLTAEGDPEKQTYDNTTLQGTHQTLRHGVVTQAPFSISGDAGPVLGLPSWASWGPKIL